MHGLLATNLADNAKFFFEEEQILDDQEEEQYLVGLA